MEAFQGQYKDGTNGTWDFRIVSALYLIVRIALTSVKRSANIYTAYFARTNTLKLKLTMDWIWTLSLTGW